MELLEPGVPSNTPLWLVLRLVSLQSARNALATRLPLTAPDRRHDVVTELKMCVKLFGESRGNCPGRKYFRRWWWNQGNRVARAFLADWKLTSLSTNQSGVLLGTPGWC